MLLTAAAAAQAGSAFDLRADGWHAPSKPAAAVLDYSVNWAPWLSGDTIVTSTWTCDTGITSSGAVINQAAVTLGQGSQQITVPAAMLATIWLSGGSAGQTYNVSDTITTTAGRTEVVKFKITVY